MIRARLSAIALSLLVGCSAHASNIRLDSESLVGEYGRDRAVKLSVRNQGKYPVKVYSNAEIFENGEWQTWPYGIESGIPEGISTIHDVDPDGVETLVLDFSKVVPPPIPPGERPICKRELDFRFRVVVIEGGDASSELHSKPFRVIDPYGICASDGRVSP
jgi:hypothetical protein